MRELAANVKLILVVSHPILDSHSRASTLLEALPYIQNFRGQTFLIKVGGSAMEDLTLVDSLLRDVVFLEAVGINPIIVHGGGKAISAAMKQAGLEAQFIGGLRVTDQKAIDIVEKTLANEINPDLVRRLTSFGGRALGIPGTEIFTGERTPGRDPQTGESVDLGFVGKVVDFNLQQLTEAVEKEIVPVLSPVAREKGTQNTLNINADIAAAALAGKLKVSKLIFLSDVLGVMRNPSDPRTLISTLRPDDIASLQEAGIISGGMIPKMKSALEALHDGVNKVHLIDGRIPHSLILEIFSDHGIGTEILL